MDVQQQAIASVDALAQRADYLSAWCRAFRPDHSSEYEHRAQALRTFAAEVIAAAESLEHTASMARERGR